MTKKQLIVPALIALISAFLRFYHLKQNFVFGVDEEYQAYLAQSIIKNFHIIWIGVGSTADFYLGPFWTYLTSLLLFISRGDPLITGYFAAFLGVVTTLIIYAIGKRVFGKKVGIISGLLYAILPVFVFYDQKYWNVSLIPILSLVMFYSILKIAKNQKWLIVFALAFGLVFHSHLSLVFFGLIFLYWILINKVKFKIRIILVSCFLFLAIYSPLLVFDYFHNWSNLSTPLRIIQNIGKSGSSISLDQKFSNFANYLGRVFYLMPSRNNADEVNWGCIYARSNSFMFVGLFSLVLLLWFLLLKITWKDNGSKLLALIICVYLFVFILFPGEAYEYYLLGLFPLYLFIPSIFFERSKSFIKTFLCFLFLVISLMGVRTVLTARDDYGLKVKKELIGEVMNVVGDKPFVLSSEGKCHIAEGWRYLFSVYGRKPERSDTDKIFGWIYADEISDKPAAYNVTIQESRVLPPLVSEIKNAKVIKKGGFKAYIINQKERLK